VRRTGIDLSPARCIVVDAEISRRFRKDGEPKPVRLHRVARISHLNSPAALTEELRRLIEREFPKRAWVNLWDVPSSHQYLLLPTAPRPELRAAAARHGAATLGLEIDEVAVGTSIGEPRGEPGHPSKTEVSFFAASVHEIRSRLQPIFDAGFQIEGVTTPCGALWSQARLRRPASAGDVHAFVVLNTDRSALAMFANGFLLYARDLSWGFEGPAPVMLGREELASRLTTELRRSFLYLKQYWEQDVSQLVLCGDMPDLRSLTAPLIERLNIEVETLDTLEGIDASALPEPADRFSGQVASYRLAAAIAAEPTPVNLLPGKAATEPVKRGIDRIFATSTAAAIAIAAFLYAHASVERTAAEQQLAAMAAKPSNSLSSKPAAGASVTPALDERQGARVAGLLSVLEKSAPPGVTLSGVTAAPDGDRWRVSVEATSRAENAAAARAGAEDFLLALERVPAFGSPIRPATRRVLSNGTTVELVAEYAVRQ
jgi:hypothetical protein